MDMVPDGKAGQGPTPATQPGRGAPRPVDPQPPPAADPQAPWWLREAILVLAGLALLVAYIVRADPADVWTSLRRVGPAGILLATLVAVAGWGPRIAAYHAFAHTLAPPTTWRESARASLGANAANLLLPARLGDVLLAIELAAHRSWKRVASLLVLWRGTSTLGLAVLAGATLLALWGPTLLPATAALPLFLAGMAAGALAVALVLASGLRVATAWLTRRQRRLAASLDVEPGPGPAAPIGVGLLLLGTGLAIAAWLSEVAVAAVLLAHISPNTPLLHATLATLAGLAAKALRITPGGLGLYEGAFAGLLWSLGVDGAAAVAAGVLSGLLGNLVTLTLGGSSAVWLFQRNAATSWRLLRRRRRSSSSA